MVKIVKFLNLDEGEQKFDIAYPFTQSVPLKEYKMGHLVLHSGGISNIMSFLEELSDAPLQLFQSLKPYFTLACLSMKRGAIQ